MDQRVCAVIVTHDIGEKVLETLEGVAAMVDYCVIVDNASTDDTVNVIRDYCLNQVHKFEVIEHPVNNLARAQNLGIRRAREQGYGWVLLLDHDSTPDIYMVSELQAAYAAHPHPEHIAMIVPNLADRFSRRAARYARHTRRAMFFRSGFGDKLILDDVMVAIASGSLIPMQTFDDIGVMNETLCIDNVDYDFSLRAIRRGKKILAVRAAVLHHALGHCQDHQLAGLCVTTTNHSPIRRYYIYRNRLRLWRMHGMAVPAFVMLDVCAIGYDLFKIVFFEQYKRAKFRAIITGLRDALWVRNNRPQLPADVSIAITKH